MITDIFLGSDLVNCQRLQSAFEQFGLKYFEKFLTPTELQHCLGQQNSETSDISSQLSQAQYLKLGSRIAIKEAVAKALGCGLNGLGYSDGINWHHIHIIARLNKAPEIELVEKAKNVEAQHHVTRWKVSISHDGNYAMATVIGLAK